MASLQKPGARKHFIGKQLFGLQERGPNPLGGRHRVGCCEVRLSAWVTVDLEEDGRGAGGGEENCLLMVD